MKWDRVAWRFIFLIKVLKCHIEILLSRKLRLSTSHLVPATQKVIGTAQQISPVVNFCSISLLTCSACMYCCCCLVWVTSQYRNSKKPAVCVYGWLVDPGCRGCIVPKPNVGHRHHP